MLLEISRFIGYDHATMKKQINDFQTTIWNYYQLAKRPFPWRTTPTPYHVFISEVMLQQTQTDRVHTKYEQWLTAFPDFATLATAPFVDVLHAWHGLGYNRRAQYLQKAAQIILSQYAGELPNDPDELVKLPGIGNATAASICAFAFNNPTVFIETNIRTVFIHFFFKKQEGVSDKEIIRLVELSLDHDNPREWYYALMDYGVMLKKQLPNPSRKSKHYTKQSKFAGSDRQIRGAILKTALLKPNLSNHAICSQLAKTLKTNPSRIEKIMHKLESEHFIQIENSKIRIAKNL